MAYKHLLVHEGTHETIKRAASERGMTMVEYVEYLLSLDTGDAQKVAQGVPLTDEEKAQINELLDKEGQTTITVSKLTSLLLDFLVSERRMRTTKWNAVYHITVQNMRQWGEPE
jgi:hypothetical protein